MIETAVVRLRPRSLASPSGLSLAGGLVLAQVLLVVLALSDSRLGDQPLMLITLPLALGAVRLGFRGSVVMSAIASSLAGVWWASRGGPGGLGWLGSRTVTYFAIAVVIGWVVASRRRLLTRLSHHNELSLDLIATANFDGYFTQLNPAFTRVLGYTSEELMARPLLEFIHPDDREPTLAAIREQTEQGHSIFHFQNRYRTKDGSYRWLEWTSKPDPEAQELVAVARDVTDRKTVEEIEHEHTLRLERAVDTRTQELRRANEELETARRDNLRRLALAAEYRDDETHQHTVRIGRAAALLASELGLPDADVQLIEEAATLHDIGKIAVSDAILLKPGKLTPNEYEQMKRHAEAGAAILSNSESPVLQMAEQISVAHHEWWDGSGYPHSLQGEAIPLPARIVAVVDVFDALTHERPYKRAWPLEDALSEIQRLRGCQFDPAVVDAFLNLDPAALLAHAHTPHLALAS
jgi:PAS domain S-box-containing protein/putative nucleotidyltransferase with HDIG domain